MIFYVDDLNLPYIETYGTQNSLSLMRQIMDHKSYYDRTDLGFRKEVADCYFMASMNPTAGSFTITERLQRLFTTFACLMPSDGDLSMIFRAILTGHLRSFAPDVQKLSDVITEASIKLHKSIATEFLPDAERFMYNWNMREITNVYQGLCSVRPEYYPNQLKFLRLWLHECERVFSDRLVDEDDTAKFDAKIRAVTKACFKDTDQEALYAGPVIFTSFAAQPGGEPSYLPLPIGDPGYEMLSKTLVEKLEDYNSSHSIMDLVLFQQAMEHVCRICRIITNPGGNAMLIGVGGSGKQSLSRLAAHICSYDIRQLAVTSRFTVTDLKESLKEMYRTAGVKGQGLVFLLTDSQIINDKFLVYVNDILSSGWINDLFERDEIDAIFGSLRNEAKAQGVLIDIFDEMLKFFIARVRLNLHLILCFSPVGASFRVRARRFPGLINCTVIDKFHPWPKDALISVASRFIDDVDLGSDAIKQNVALHMAEVHMAVTTISEDFKEKMRRYNYVTPKSFLELIAFYRFLLNQKRDLSGKQINRLDEGLAKLRQTADDVAELKIDVQRAMAKAEEEVSNTDMLVAQINREKAAAAEEAEAAGVIAERAKSASEAAAKVEGEAEKELAEAKPALERATEAVRCLDKASLTELKNFKSPPKGVERVTATVLMMIEGEFKNHEKWDRAKKMMADVGQFLQSLEKYDARNMSEELISRLEPYVKSEGFTEQEMKSKSAAAANLCSFVVNIFTFNRIYVKVKPLMDSLEKAQAERQAAQAELDSANARMAKVMANLATLEQTLEEAIAKKIAAENEAGRCSDRLALANRLVGGLASENERWGVEVQKLRDLETMLIGDVLLASAFVSYIGAFNNVYRRKLWSDTWIPDIRARSIPLDADSDPLRMLTDEGKTATMMNEGLPADRISIENGAIITSCKRWPLVIDPQLQGIKWLKKKEELAVAAAVAAGATGGKLSVVQLTQPNWLKTVVSAIQQGTTVIIENVTEDIDATLEPVLSRAVYPKGRTLYLKVGGEETEYDPRFKLYLQTKLPNPHYRPEIQAQCTLVNFIATESGLQDQLLARVVREEKAELEQTKQELAEAFNRYKVELLQLEDDLLNRLANAPEDILSDVALIEGLEATKKASVEINAAVAKGRLTEIAINEARQVYVPVAEEGAMLYFMITQLNGIEHMYQYSLDSFTLYFYKAIREAPKQDDIKARVGALKDTIRLVIYTWVVRGLFERHKLILLCQLTFQLMARGKLHDAEEFAFSAFQFLLRGPKKLGEPLPSTLDWLPEPAWNSLQALADLDGGEFTKLPSDLSEAPLRFKEWFNHVTPETEKLPLDWSSLDKTPFKKLLVLRCMRPDRLNVALREFVNVTLPLGGKFVDCDATLNSTQILEETLHDSNPSTPIFFILSAGADVVSDVDKLAARAGLSKGVSYHNVSMGQGQDVVAMEKLEMGHKQGHWVLLNNVHLMPRWLIELEKKLDQFSQEGSHEKFRIFLTAEPSVGIPIGILNRSIKLTNEPPQGLKANLKRAFCSFSPEFINDADAKMRAILFGLCYFHACMIERKKFGPKGFNMMYPFSLGDLRDSSVCLMNYMEGSTSGKIPWEDLRYIFGQIMYGGHIVNDLDRLLTVAYLEHFLRDELLDEMELFPFAKDEKASFKSPSPTTYDRYLEHIETEFKGDTPIAFGLHPNAEIGFRTEQSETLLRTLLELQPRDSSASSADDKSPRALAAAAMQEFVETFGETTWDTDEIQAGMEDVGPFQNVLILELKQMNNLLSAMKRSLATLKLGFDGKLTMSEDMERLETELALDKVPSSWAKLAWPSMRGLASWKHNLSARCNQLSEWVGAPAEPLKVTWLSGLINPQSFLTAIRQQTAQRTGQELDKLVIQTDVTKRSVEEVDGTSRDGCYIYGLFMVGARFDVAGGVVDKSKPREMYCDMPVINCKSVLMDKLEEKGTYQCPVYKTEARGPTFVFNAQLKTKSPAARWIMAGVALILDLVL
jgi:dynein heavy chain